MISYLQVTWDLAIWLTPLKYNVVAVLFRLTKKENTCEIDTYTSVCAMMDDWIMVVWGISFVLVCTFICRFANSKKVDQDTGTSP